MIVTAMLEPIQDTDLCTCGHFWAAHDGQYNTKCHNCPRLKKKQKCNFFEKIKDNLTLIEVLAKKRKLI